MSTIRPQAAELAAGHWLKKLRPAVSLAAENVAKAAAKNLAAKWW